MKKILIVSHCLLNTAAKVKGYQEAEIEKEEQLRLQVIKKALEEGVQILQLPCPEFIQYGARRWGHTKEQFDNPFFRQACKEMLQPVVLQIKEYLASPQEFKILGIVGIDGSPSCGVKYTCSASWGGDFGGRDVTPVLNTCKLVEESGVFISVLKETMEENGISLPIEGLFAEESERVMKLFEEK